LVVTLSTSAETVKILDHPWILDFGERATIGAAVPRFGVPVGGSPARAVVA
jgi:hypothetical protein